MSTTITDLASSATLLEASQAIPQELDKPLQAILTGAVTCMTAEQIHRHCGAEDESTTRRKIKSELVGSGLLRPLKFSRSFRWPGPKSPTIVWDKKNLHKPDYSGLANAVVERFVRGKARRKPTGIRKSAVTVYTSEYYLLPEKIEKKFLQMRTEARRDLLELSDDERAAKTFETIRDVSCCIAITDLYLAFTQRHGGKDDNVVSQYGRHELVSLGKRAYCRVLLSVNLIDRFFEERKFDNWWDDDYACDIPMQPEEKVAINLRDAWESFVVCPIFSRLEIW